MSKPAFLQLFFAVLFLICGCFAVSGQTRTAILVAAETTIEKDRIELSDIAQFDQNVAGNLKTVSLGYAPQPGATREILREKIALAVAAAGFAANEITLRCPAKILIRRRSQKINSDLLRQAIEKAVLAQFQTEKVSARISRLETPESIEVESGQVSVRASVANVRNYFAPFIASLEISVNSRVVRRVSATVQIEATADVLVAARDLTAQDKLAESDFRIDTRPLEKPLQNYLRDPLKLRGALLLKNLAAGTELTTDVIAAGIAVKNGDSVRILGQSGKIQISVAGEARAAGRIGDRIAVKNLASNAVLQATIVDEGLVKISF